MSKLAITAVVGAQFGSEGKGAVVSKIAASCDVWVRSGGPNAGHTHMHEGVEYKQLMLPVGWVNSKAALVIAPGAVLDPVILLREIKEAESRGCVSIWGRLFIDHKAIPLVNRHADDEGGVDGMLHAIIGSTGKGVGAARAEHAARLGRLGDFGQRAAASIGQGHPQTSEAYREATDELAAMGVFHEDTAGLIRDIGGRVGLEGTQGFGLSLYHGEWPYVTSADTTAAYLCAAAGLPANAIDRCILVARSMPIRVAGNSGPLPHEITWPELSERLGRKVGERTTVTNKVRRIAEFDLEIVKRAAFSNGATEFVLTFADYLHRENHHKTVFDDLSIGTQSFVQHIQSELGIPCSMIGTGYDQRLGWTCVDRQDELNALRAIEIGG